MTTTKEKGEMKLYRDIILYAFQVKLVLIQITWL